MRDLPERLKVTAILDWRPRYLGTSHEDETARAMGFRGALLPGVFVYGHATRLAVAGWGADWLARGTARVRFRRPVYNGDPLLVERGAVERSAAALTARITVTNTATGEVVLDGAIGLPDHAPDPPPNLPLLPIFTPKLVLTPGSAPEGLQLGSAAINLTSDVVASSLADFHETEPVFAARQWVHSGCLIRKTMGDVLDNLTLPMPVIFAGLEMQTLALAPIGASYRTSARITRVWETRGKHYFETEEWLLADGRPVACHFRQNLYAITG
ncbi:MAG: hypothetical protein ACOH2H_19855 [Cypionkella sp.]